MSDRSSDGWSSFSSKTRATAMTASMKARASSGRSRRCGGTVRQEGNSSTICSSWRRHSASRAAASRAATTWNSSRCRSAAAITCAPRFSREPPASALRARRRLAAQRTPLPRPSLDLTLRRLGVFDEAFVGELPRLPGAEEQEHAEPDHAAEAEVLIELRVIRAPGLPVIRRARVVENEVRDGPGDHEQAAGGGQDAGQQPHEGVLAGDVLHLARLAVLARLQVVAALQADDVFLFHLAGAVRAALAQPLLGQAVGAGVLLPLRAGRRLRRLRLGRRGDVGRRRLGGGLGRLGGALGRRLLLAGGLGHEGLVALLAADLPPELLLGDLHLAVALGADDGDGVGRLLRHEGLVALLAADLPPELLLGDLHLAVALGADNGDGVGRLLRHEGLVALL